MTEEKRQLLLKDLCARLPYSIWGLHRGEDLPLYVIDDSGAYMVLGYNAWFNLDTVPFKPYLRPMSSMTEEEKEEESDLWNEHDTNLIRGMLGFYCRHHLDWNNLIPIGLALEAPEGMYKDN